MKHGPLNPELHKVCNLHHGRGFPIVHIASENNIVTPEGYESKIHATLCGRALHWSFLEDDISLLYADGKPARKLCPICVKWFAFYIAAYPEIKTAFDRSKILGV